jgi:hypothetical protein
VKLGSALAAVGLTMFCFFLPLARAGSTYRVLHDFGAAGDGTLPFGPLLLSEGILYGVTFTGGTGAKCDYGCGTVSQLERGANGVWTENVLYSFEAGSDGDGPYGNLLLDSAGNLLGTVQGDLSFAVGGVFELAHGSGVWTNTIIYGISSGPGLVFDKLGNLYGDMNSGSDVYGNLGELSPGSDGWTYAALADFSDALGYSPPAPPIWGGKGDLYGVTIYGGISKPACPSDFGCGVVFQMIPHASGKWSYNVLHEFASSSTDGQTPSGGLVMGEAGGLYGVTEYGGAYNNGRVFEMTPPGSGETEWTETALYDFPNCSQGCLPAGTMVFDHAGNLYGVASGGKPDCGGYDCGVVFKLSPQTGGGWSYSVVHTFTGTDGSSPVGVIVDEHGNLFGTTSNGGTYNTGVAFEIIP